MRPARRGLTLVEILIVMAILATLAAVLYPSVSVQLRRGQSTALANQMDNLRQALSNFQQNVTKYPLFLTQLTAAPVNGDDDSCGANLTTGNRNAWRGPYLTQSVNGNIPVGDATVDNQLIRLPSTGTLAMLRITVTGVTQNSATDLELQFDGNNDFTSGTILWVAGTETMTFQIPIRGC